MDDKKKKYTVEELKEWYIDQAKNAKNSEDSKNYAQSLSFLMDSETKERTAYEKLDIEKQHADEEIELKREEINAQAKSNRISIITAVVTGALSIASIVIGKKVEGKEDRRYQEEGYNHEKTEGTIYKYTKHSRPKHGPVKMN